MQRRTVQLEGSFKVCCTFGRMGGLAFWPSVSGDGLPFDFSSLVVESVLNFDTWWSFSTLVLCSYSLLLGGLPLLFVLPCCALPKAVHAASAVLPNSLSSPTLQIVPKAQLHHFLKLCPCFGNSSEWRLPSESGFLFAAFFPVGEGFLHPSRFG